MSSDRNGRDERRIHHRAGVFDEGEGLMASIRKRFQLWLAEWRKRRAIALVRREMAALGFPLGDLSDAEMLEGAARVAEASAAFGISTQEVEANIARALTASRSS